LDGNSPQTHEIRLHGALEIEIVIDFLNGGIVGKAVGELERAEPGLHLVRRRDGRRNFGTHLHLWCGLRVRGGCGQRANKRSGEEGWYACGFHWLIVFGFGLIASQRRRRA
jgi:hypothetical protein